MLVVRDLVKIYPGPVTACRVLIWTCQTACSVCWVPMVRAKRP